MISGDQVEAGGQNWYPIRTFDVTEGYVPSTNLTRTQGTTTTTPAGERK